MRHQVTLENTACTNVPHFLAGGEDIEGPSTVYMLDHLSAGLEIGSDGREGGVTMRHKLTPLQQAARMPATTTPG